MKLKKILISTLSAVAILFGTLAPEISTMAAESQVIENDDIEVIPERAMNGETVILPENENKPFEEMDYNLDIVSKEDWENTDIGEYPIDVHSTEWSQLSYSEAAAACNMPKEYAESLTTEELVDYVVNYPFLMNILAFDNIADGINNLANKSSAFEELFSRSDCYDKLLIKYLNMEINYTELAESNDVCETGYDSELFIEAYIGLNYDLLSENQAEIFVEEYGNKYSSLNSECQESILFTLFYDAIEEKMGVIPESAIPESVISEFVDSANLTDDIILPGFETTCDVCSASQYFDSMAVNFDRVYYRKWLSGGLTETDIKQLDKYIADNFPSFSKVRSASSKYNCHSYAWYSTETSNIYWIDNPRPFYNGYSKWTEWRIPMRNIKDGDRITFWSGDVLLHSAIVNSVTDCTSKLGHYGVYKTTISEMESFYNSSTTQAYLPK